jgi:hypothetical protein
MLFLAVNITVSNEILAQHMPASAAAALLIIIYYVAGYCNTIITSWKSGSTEGRAEGKEGGIEYGSRVK